MSQTSPSPHQQAWDAAVRKVEQELGSKNFRKFLQIRDYDACLKELQSRNNRFSRQWPRLKAVVGPVLDVLRTFDRAVATCCQSNPQAACLVWGGVQIVFTIEIAAKYSDCARRVAEMLEQLSKSLPRFEDYVRHFPTNDRLHLRLVSVYETFVIFCARAFRFLDSRFLTAIVKATWFSLDQKFTSTVESIINDKNEMENEVRAANIDVGFNREAAAEGRHQAVMATIPTALKRSNLIESTLIVPHARNSTIVGRAKELKRLHKYLSESRSSGNAEPKIMAIRGIGGVGKTQLALEYLFLNKQAYNGRFWIRAENSTLIQQDFAQISKILDTEDAAVGDLTKAVQKVKDWLSATDETWLLVFDNVKAAADIKEYLPTSGRGSIVVTTRDRDTADGLSQWTKTIELEGLQEIDAIALLHQIDPAIPECDLARRIVDDLGGLPLAVCQMGSYIRQTKCTLNQFYSILQSRSERFYLDTASITTLQYSMTLAQCCDMSIELLSEDDIYLLGTIALFQTDEIQEKLITQGCQGIPRMDHLADPCNWNDAIRTLTKHSLVTISQKDSHRSLRIHRVVKRRAIHVLEAAPPSSKGAFRDAAILLNGMFPRRPVDGGTMTKQWVDCELWLPHVLSLREAFKTSSQLQEEVPRKFVEILCNCAWYMWERGAEHAFEFATHTLETIMGALKIVNFQLRRDCVEAFQKALDIRQRYMAKTLHPSLDERRMIANNYNNAGAARLVLEEYPEAMYLFQKSLDLKRTLGDESTIPYDIGVSLYNICRVQMGEGLVEEAKKNAKKALDLVESYNGPEDFRTMQFRFTYADLLVASAEVEEGLNIHEYTLDVRKRVMGNEHNDTGVSYYGLSCLYQQLGRFEDALTSVANAIEVFTRILGAEDRVARLYFRKHLILKDLRQDADSGVALSEARRYRQALGGKGVDWDDTMHDYDFLVSYCNK